MAIQDATLSHNLTGAWTVQLAESLESLLQSVAFRRISFSTKPSLTAAELLLRSWANSDSAVALKQARY